MLTLWLAQAHAGTTYGPSGGKYRPPAAAPSGLTLIEIEGSDIGGRRSAYVHAPSGGGYGGGGSTSGPLPVILAFHGGRNNSGLDMVERLEEAEREDVLLVYPNGTRTGSKDAGWTGPDHEDEADALRDVHFVRALIDELDRKYDIDRDRVFAAGFSGGAYLTDWLWCQASDEIHGFFVVSRAMPIEISKQCPASPSRPMALILGTDDDGLVNRHQMSFSETQAFIAGKLGCNKEPRTETLPDRGDRTTVRHSTWSGCDRGSAFEYWEVEGGGHYWPGPGKPEPDKSIDIDATTEMLRFFRDHGGL
jgi:polyhydroxybutyrate depolymerase